MKNGEKPITNPYVMLREEFDDWAILFDPDTGHGFGLNPVGVYVWKLLDGEHTIDEMLEALRQDVEEVPQEAGDQILAFVEELTQHGLAAYDVKQFHDGRKRILPRTAGIAENLPVGGREAGRLGPGMLRYERPRLEVFTLERRAQGQSCIAGGGCNSGSGEEGECCPGNSAAASTGYACHNGIAATGGQWACGSGTNATGGTQACVSGITASGASGGWNCNLGSSGGACSNGSEAY